MSKRFLFFFLGACLCITASAQTSYDPPLLTTPDGDTSICQGQSLSMHAELSPSNPIGVDPGEGEGGGKIDELSDDEFSSVIDIGFTFNFYGVDYTQCVISSNNYITFNTGLAGGYSGWSITDEAPSANTPANSIMCPWQDINPGLGGIIQYQTIGEAPNRVFIVEYCSVPMFSCVDIYFSDQIKLFEGSNIIETHIIEKPLCEEWNDGLAIHGLCKDEDLAHIVPGRNFPEAWMAFADGYRFSPDPDDADNYFIEPIPYSPFLMNVTNDDIEWFEEGNPYPIATGTDVTVTPTSSPTYYVVSITSGGDCNGVTYTDTIFVDFNAIFYDTLSKAICRGETYDFYGVPVYQPGMYNTTITTLDGCDTAITLYLTNNPLPNVDIGTNMTDICEGETAVIVLTSPTGNASYQWMRDGAIIPGETGNTYDATSAGAYRVRGVTNKGCVDTSKKINIVINPAAVAEILNISAQDVCIGDTVTVSAAPGPGYNYHWEPEAFFRYTSGFLQQEADAVVPKTGEIYLTVTNAFGCRDWDTTILIAHPCCDIANPSAFSPNGDGLNDFFNPLMQPGQKIVALQVFDRKGKQIYNNEEPQKGWDGRYPNGEDAAQDTYMYRLVYTCTDGQVFETKNDITLIR